MRKWLCVCLALMFTLGLTACGGISEYEFDEAVEEAYRRGYEEGYGTANAEWENIEQDIRQDGYSEGFTSGQFSGYAEGYEVGYQEGRVDVADHGANMDGLWAAEDVRDMIAFGDLTLDEFLDSYERLIEYLYRVSAREE